MITQYLDAGPAVAEHLETLPSAWLQPHTDIALQLDESTDISNYTACETCMARQFYGRFAELFKFTMKLNWISIIHNRRIHIE